MPGRKHSDAIVAARREEIEAVLRAGRWSLQVCRKLAERHGVREREIQRDRVAVEVRWKSAVKPREEQRVEFLEEARAMRHRLEERGHDMAAARILALEARVRGLEQWRVDVDVSGQVDLRFASDSEALAEIRRALAIPAVYRTIGYDGPPRHVVEIEEDRDVGAE